MTVRKEWLAKREIPHKKLQSVPNSWKKTSARYKYKKGDIVDGRELVDIIAYPVNVCAHCGSEATWHRRVQFNGDVVDNCWSVERRYDGGVSVVTIKYDFCLDCQEEFIIEIFIFKKATVTKETQKSDFWWNRAKK